MSDRKKGAALARKCGAPNTAKVIETACYRDIFTTTIEEIGAPKLVRALAEAKNPLWAYYALHRIPYLSVAQRTTLKKIVLAIKGWELPLDCGGGFRQSDRLGQMDRAARGLRQNRRQKGAVPWPA